MDLWTRTGVLLMVVAVVNGRSAADQGSYTTRFDGVNVEAVLRNDRILRRYVECVLDKGPCTAEGRELKKRIPDALQGDCSKCSDVQRRQARRVLEFLVKHKRNYWDQLAAKYDPSGSFRKKYALEQKEST